MNDVASIRVRYAGRALRAVAALLLCACFSSNKPIDSTQTGNPPIIDAARIALKTRDGELHVTGLASAVSPPGSAVQITNLTSGAMVSATTAADGSFDAKVAGMASDVFEVHAQAQGSVVSSAVYVVPGGAAAVATGAKAGQLSCQQASDVTKALLQQTAAASDQHCLVDSDCHAVLRQATCQRACEYSFFSAAGSRQFESVSEAISQALCNGCEAGVVPCPGPPTTACIAGTCARASLPADLSCDERASKAQQLIWAAADAADTTCMADSDCTEVSRRSLCNDDCGGHTPLSRTGRTSVEAAIAGVEAGVCASYKADGCSFLALPCAPPTPTHPACVAGQCMSIGSVTPDAGMPDCVTCLMSSLQWGLDGGFVAYQDTSTLAPCIHYTRQRKEPGPNGKLLFSCETDFVACNAITSSGAVLSALSNADVQEALRQGYVLYGRDTRPADGNVFQVKNGSATIEVGGSCDGAPPNCIPAPAGVQALVDLLRNIDTQLAGTPSCEQFKP